MIFNSSLLYELSVYKSYLNNIFAKVSKQEANYEKISELLGLVNHFESIDTDLTPKTSLLREFVGGSNYTI